MSRLKVLIVEDDRTISDVLTYNLTEFGFEVLATADGLDGIDKARKFLPDVVLLDVMLPGIDGLEVCRQLRQHAETKTSKIIMLTAKSEEADQLVGFNVGADDYVIKPFSIRVLIERIKSLCRRTTADESQADPIISYGAISIDRVRHRVVVDDEQILLTASEFRLLEALIRQPGRVFERVELIESALGADTLVLERTIDVHIRALRKKLGRHADRIETVRGVGYRFREQPEEK
jgi:two-component system, OmpR family, phosphate regulon response regulator PhoB